MERLKEIIDRYSRTEQIIAGSLVVVILAVSALYFGEVGEETTMVCTHRVAQDHTFKYVDPLVGSPKIYVRGSSGWSGWSGKKRADEKYDFVDIKDEVSERTFRWEARWDQEADKDYTDVPKGEKFRAWIILEGDFEFLKLTKKYWTTRMDGSASGESSRQYPIIQKYTCTKHDPDTPMK